jgi:hypothetical protein
MKQNFSSQYHVYLVALWCANLVKLNSTSPLHLLTYFQLGCAARDFSVRYGGKGTR